MNRKVNQKEINMNVHNTISEFHWNFGNTFSIRISLKKKLLEPLNIPLNFFFHWLWCFYKVKMIATKTVKLLTKWRSTKILSKTRGYVYEIIKQLNHFTCTGNDNSTGIEYGELLIRRRIPIVPLPICHCL